MRCVLEGGVRKNEQRIRIMAQLIDAKDGAQVWAERYDGAIDYISAIQDEITLVQATEILVKLRAAGLMSQSVYGHEMNVAFRP